MGIIDVVYASLIANKNILNYLVTNDTKINAMLKVQGTKLTNSKGYLG